LIDEDISYEKDGRISDDDSRNDERGHGRPSRPSRYSENISAKKDRPKREEEHFFDEATLRNIPPRAGFVQRWVRVKMPHSKDPDTSNYDKKIQRGWRPRSIDTCPGYKHPDLNIGTSEGIIRVAGHILMERPIELQERERAHIDHKTAEMTKALNLNAGDMPKSNKYFGDIQIEQRKVNAEIGYRPVKVAD
jgi:hypothetical protein